MRNNKGLIFALAAAGISGFSIFLSKLAIGQGDAVLFSALKNLGALALVALVSLNFSEIRMAFSSGKSALSSIYLGLLGGGVAFVLFFEGLKVTTALSANFFHKSMFFFVSILSVFAFRKAVPMRSWGISGLLVVGNLLFWNYAKITLNYGDILVIAATAIWALEAVLAEGVLRSVSPTSAVAIRFAGGLPVFLAYLLYKGTNLLNPFSSLSSFAWTMGLALVLALYALSYFSAIKWLGAFETTAVLSIAPAITLLLSAGKFTALQAAGSLFLALAVAAIAFFSWKEGDALAANKTIQGKGHY